MTAIIGAPYPKPGVHCPNAQKAYDRAAEAVRHIKNDRTTDV